MDLPGRGKRVAVAVSGGVDSLCALLLLKNSGYDVFALHGIFAEEFFDIANLQKLCGILGVAFHLVDLRDVFADRLAGTFARSWINGLTPNPCALCNRDIKFGALFKRAVDLGADFFATGHYAHIVNHPVYKRLLLAPASHLPKDQSYFLSLLPGDILDKVFFPLAGYSKNECRQIVASYGFVPPSQEESQDICFVQGEKNYVNFVRDWAHIRNIRTDDPGDIYIMEKDSVGRVRKKLAGKHKGLINYTVGQRKGLNIPWSEPLYVLAKDKASNSLVLSPRSGLNLKKCQIGNVNYFVSVEEWPDRLFSRLRYRQKPAKTAVKNEGDKIGLFFEDTQFPGAEGQVATIEDSDGVILAAGLIEKMEFEGFIN